MAIGDRIKGETTEARLQQQCFMWHWNYVPLERGRLLLMHNNPRNKIDGSILIGMGMIKGASDLIYLRPVRKSGSQEVNQFLTAQGLSQPHFLECKLSDGRQSTDQKMFQLLVQGLGFRYDIFRSLDEFKKLING